MLGRSRVGPPAIAIGVAGAVIVGLLAGLPASSADTGQTLLLDSFERPDADVIANGWVQTGTAAGLARLRAGKLRIDTRDDAYAPVATRSFPRVASGAVEWSFVMDFTRAKAEATYEVRMQLLDSAAGAAPAVAPRAGVAVDLRWGGASGAAADQSLAAQTATGLAPIGVVTGPVTVTVIADLDAGTAVVSAARSTGVIGSATVALPPGAALDTVRFFSNGLNDRNFTGRTFDNVRVAIPATSPGTTTTTTLPTTVTTDPTATATTGTVTTTTDTTATTGTATSTTTSAATTVTSSTTDTTTTTATGPTPFSGVLLSDTFTRPAAAALGGPWSEIEDSTNQVAGNGNAMTFTSNDGANIPLARAVFERQTQGTLTWDFLLNWKRTGTENTFGVIMRLADAGPAGTGTGTTAAELVWGGINPLGLATDLGFGYRQGGVTTQLAVVNAPTRVRVVADLAARTYSLDLDPADGRVEATGLPLGGTAVSAVEYRTLGVSTPKFSPAGFDDVSVSVLGGTTGGTTTTTTTTPPPPPPGTGNVVTIAGNRILVNGVPTKLTGVRIASAALSDDLTNQLIANLDIYKSYGVNSFAVYYMGSRGNQAWPFYDNGLTVDPVVQARLDRIIDAADDRGMVVVVGIFFQGPRPQVSTAEGVFNIVRTVATAIRRHRNVIVNVMNEQNTGGYSPYAGFYDFRVPENAMHLCDVYNEVDPNRIIGVGGYAPSNNDVIAVDPRCDVLFANNGDSGDRYDRYVAKGMTKPMINPEILGQTLQPVPGVFDPAVADTYNENLDDAAVRPGLNVFFHNRQWIQDRPYRYDLGGLGTPTDPGIRWWFVHAELLNPNPPA